MQIELFDAQTVDHLVWPDNESARLAKALLVPMIKEGVATFIRNVETQLYLLKVNQQIVPLTVNDKEYSNSYLTSNFFPIKYLIEQLNKKRPRLHRLKKPLIKGAGGLLKAVKINKTVIVNNWLLTTNIYPLLTEVEWQSVTDFLKIRFPDHTLIFRSLNEHACKELIRQLVKQKYRLIYSRHVCIYEPEEKAHFTAKTLYHHRRDRRLMSSEGYEIVRYHQVNPDEGQRLIELYSSIYLARHTR